ncbi:hypothetical protein K0M31_003993 [Melipona bicolor]|uniref:Uncharacterized protein n=1 Tax=Melipona bicolor TaxID=60889 RepID=A0AA40KP07_9HYME|nr:hypothetical protein K0M31_003993 [Melipona bicolor]
MTGDRNERHVTLVASGGMLRRDGRIKGQRPYFPYRRRETTRNRAKGDPAVDFSLLPLPLFGCLPSKVSAALVDAALYSEVLASTQSPQSSLVRASRKAQLRQFSTAETS